MFGNLADLTSETQNIINSFGRMGESIAQRKAQESALIAQQEQFRQNLLQRQKEFADRQAYNQEMLRLRAKELASKGSDFKFTGIAGQIHQGQVAQDMAAKGLMSQKQADEITSGTKQYEKTLGMRSVPMITKLSSDLQDDKNKYNALLANPNATQEQKDDAQAQIILTERRIAKEAGTTQMLQQADNLKIMQHQLEKMSSPILKKALEKYSGIGGQTRFWADKLFGRDNPEDEAIYNEYNVFKDSGLNMVLEEFRKSQGTSVEMRYIVNMLTPVFDPTHRVIGETPELAKLRWKAAVEAVDDLANYYNKVALGKVRFGTPYEPKKSLVEAAKKYNEEIQKNIRNASTENKLMYKAQNLINEGNDVVGVPVKAVSNFLGSLKKSNNEQTITNPIVEDDMQLNDLYAEGFSDEQ